MRKRKGTEGEGEEGQEKEEEEEEEGVEEEEEGLTNKALTSLLNCGIRNAVNIMQIQFSILTLV